MVDWLTFLMALGAGLIVSAISFVGLVTLSMNIERVRSISSILIALAAGTMIGGAIFHLLPESVEASGGFTLIITFSFILGIIVSYLLESVLEWHHCRQIGGCEVPSHRHTIGAMNIWGDSIHNFIDGLTIGAGFLVNPILGFTVTLAVILHEIPQEFGDFGVLIQAGYSRRQALLYNFLSALMAMVGIIVILFLGGVFINLWVILLPFAAANFLYISLTDLMPELHKERRTKRTILQFMIMLTGIGLMILLLFLPIGV